MAVSCVSSSSPIDDTSLDQTRCVDGRLMLSTRYNLIAAGACRILPTYLTGAITRFGRTSAPLCVTSRLRQVNDC